MCGFLPSSCGEIPQRWYIIILWSGVRQKSRFCKYNAAKPLRFGKGPAHKVCGNTQFLRCYPTSQRLRGIYQNSNRPYMAFFYCFLAFIHYYRDMKKNKKNFVSKSWVGFSAISCAVMASLTLNIAWKKQQDIATLQLNQNHSETWTTTYRRQNKQIQELDTQSKKWILATSALLSWPFIVMFYADVIDTKANIKKRYEKMRKSQKTR